jgi:hypothetical protein
MSSLVSPSQGASQYFNQTVMELVNPETSSLPSSSEDVLPAIEMQNKTDRRPVMLYARQFSGQHFYLQSYS